MGQAIAERLLAARFGRSLVDHRIWLVAGRADLVCGAGREAAYIAGALGLGRLALLATLPEDDQTLRAGMAAAGWAVRTVDAHDTHAAEAALAACLRAHKPTLVLAIGAETPPDGGAPDASPDTPPNPRGAAARRAWLKRLRRHANREAFQNALTGHLPLGWQKACQPDAPLQPPHAATAELIAALARLAPILPELATLPLSEAPLLPPPHIAPFAAGALDWTGLDQAAPACLLGMSLHGGILPVSQTAATVELPRAAWRMAGARHARWLHTIAHDRPAPPLPELAIANLHVFQPADSDETLDCLILALRRADGPSVLTLPADTRTRGLPAAPRLDDPRPGASPLGAAYIAATRQGGERLGAPRLGAPRLCSRGAYLVHAPPERDLTLLAAGPALAAAVAVRARLVAHDLTAAIISMPCRALWDAQDEAYRHAVLGTAPIVAFAADALAFAGLTGPHDLIVGQDVWPPDPDATVSAILRHRRDT